MSISDVMGRLTADHKHGMAMLTESKDHEQYPPRSFLHKCLENICRNQHGRNSLGGESWS